VSDAEETGPRTPLQAIRGTHDILPAESRRWQAAEDLCRRHFELYGYREIRTPVFEPTELFVKGTGETSDIVTKEMYTFTDKSGRSLTLRPEYTPSIARAILEHRLDLKPEPLRFYYIGPMFRYDKPQKGRYRQFHQADVEVFGESDPAADAELIEMADALLRKLGVGAVETLVNSVGCPACRPAYSRALRDKAGEHREEFCEDCRRKIEINPLRVFDCKVERCRELSRGLPLVSDFLCAACAENFARVRNYLDGYGLRYRVEPRLVRGIDYYTRTTFEIVTTSSGQQNAVLGGGRYDSLMKTYGGPDIPATGFAMGMERMLEAAVLPAKSEHFIYVISLGEKAKPRAIRLAALMRGLGAECLMEFKDRPLKAQLGRAAKLGASFAVIVGEDEVEKGRLVLKDLARGAQFEEPFSWPGDKSAAAGLLKVLLSKSGFWTERNEDAS
jgi:histidyl-tRNA synthetase